MRKNEKASELSDSACYSSCYCCSPVWFLTVRVIACQNKMRQTSPTKMLVSKLLRFLNQQFRNHVLGLHWKL